jgi:Fe-S cluster biogenesis protein NfuA
MFIQTEATPNPATIKFLPGQTILEKGSMDFQSVESAKEAPLAQRLFTLQGVKAVFFGQDFVSVTKDEDTDWSMLKSMVLAMLMEHLSTGQEIVHESAKNTAAAGDAHEDDDEIVVQIKELLETRVRPAVAMDGGDIVFEDFSDGIVFLRMQGACAGCPSSTATLKSGIENMLKHFIPEVEEVRPVEY